MADNYVVGASSQGFKTKQDALINAMRNGMPDDAALVSGATQGEIDRAKAKIKG